MAILQSTAATRVNQGDPFAEQLADLLAEVTRLLQIGQRVDVESYARAYPDYAERLRELLPTMKMLAEIGISPADKEALPGEADLSESTFGTLGEFKIKREIGRGGMGVVYEAEQLSLGRRVALKILPFAAVLDDKQIQRFKNEARAAATLDHPDIVPVHSVGCERGVHYYAMQFIEGQSLAEVIGAIRAGKSGERKAESGWQRAESGEGQLADAAPSLVPSSQPLTPSPQPQPSNPKPIPSSPSPPSENQTPRRSFVALPKSEFRSPRRWTTRTLRASFTATSSRAICCSTLRGACGSPISDWRESKPTPP